MTKVYCGANFNSFGKFYSEDIRCFRLLHKTASMLYGDIYGFVQPFHCLAVLCHSISADVKARRGLRKESSRLTPVCKVYIGCSVYSEERKDITSDIYPRVCERCVSIYCNELRGISGFVLVASK